METLLELKNVSKSFSLGKNKCNFALSQINLTVARGEILGVVGESGCGKSTLAKVIMGVYKPSSGQLYYGSEKLKLTSHSQRKKFAKKAQMIFQDSYMSLDPRMTVETIIGENLEIHYKLSKYERKKQIHEQMEMIGLSREYANRFPHEFSGGQRQRIGIARALMMKPEFVICDEPTSALDISVRSQIINLLIDLKDSLGLTYLFISHDLNIVHHISDRIAVMYSGRIVELGDAKELYKKPLHPYTQILLQAVLSPIPDKESLNCETAVEGEPTTVSENEIGCHFAKRCPKMCSICLEKKPELVEVSVGRLVACHMVVGDSEKSQSA